MSPSIVSISDSRAARRGAPPEAREGADPTVAGAASPRPSARVPPTHFELAERLVQVWVRNQRNLNRLAELEVRLDGPLGETSRAFQVERLAILLRLRADDRLAAALLDEFEARRRAADERPRAFTA